MRQLCVWLSRFVLLRRCSDGDKTQRQRSLFVTRTLSQLLALQDVYGLTFPPQFSRRVQKRLFQVPAIAVLSRGHGTYTCLPVVATRSQAKPLDTVPTPQTDR